MLHADYCCCLTLVNVQLWCVESYGVELPSSSDDEDKTEMDLKAATPAAGPMTHPCGMICNFTVRDNFTVRFFSRQNS